MKRQQKTDESSNAHPKGPVVKRDEMRIMQQTSLSLCSQPYDLASPQLSSCTTEFATIVFIVAPHRGT